MTQSVSEVEGGCSSTIRSEVRFAAKNLPKDGALMKRKSEKRRGWVEDIIAVAEDMLETAPKCCEEKGYVYFVQAGPLTKIGRTEDIRQRVITLQHSSPVKLHLMALGRGSSHEGLFHMWFDGSRRHGEWFTTSAIAKWMRGWREDHCLTCEMRWRPAIAAAA